MARPKGYDHGLARDAMDDEFALRELHQLVERVCERLARFAMAPLNYAMRDVDSAGRGRVSDLQAQQLSPLPQGGGERQKISHPEISRTHESVLSRLTALERFLGSLAAKVFPKRTSGSPTEPFGMYRSPDIELQEFLSEDKKGSTPSS